MRWTPVFAFGVAMGLTGCGDDRATVPPAVAARLGDQVDAIRQAATAGDRPGAELRLEELRQTVGELDAAGDLSETAAATILTRAAVVESSLRQLPTTTTSLPAPQEREKDDKDDKEKDRGKEEEDD